MVTQIHYLLMPYSELHVYMYIFDIHVAILWIFLEQTLKFKYKERRSRYIWYYFKPQWDDVGEKEIPNKCYFHWWIDWIKF